MPREKALKGPFPIRPPTDTRRPTLAAGAAQAVHQQPTGSELGPPCPTLRANPFPDVTNPFCRLPLPTLFHRLEDVHLGDLMRSALTTAPSKLAPWVLQRPPRPPTRQGLALAPTAGPPKEFPLASPRSGIVHHLLGPNRYALTRTLHKRSGSIGGATHKRIPPIRFLAPYEFTRPLTHTHVSLLGPCFKMSRMGSQQADAKSTQVPKHAESACTAVHNRDDDISVTPKFRSIPNNLRFFD
ncbi:hypothetical protein KIW84_023610 [Lathyrus oleraceus]|uniref:Uncharacterized protein n=1 Tax=Pisum sativum TaxID=3888 RepID=A0A9D4YH96_PEA|nr:hypothetical protein KIW84_023610 [Pisum sativum]